MTKKLHNDKPHNGCQITKIEVSPNEKYIVTYSWNVVDEGQLEPEFSHKILDYHEIKQLCVSDDKKLVYINIVINYILLVLVESPIIYDMDNNQYVRLDVFLYNSSNELT
ncbi:hypothetical protein GLOIN_2v1473953 [Rhizophagus clarus]|uniref:Uncharacterized protein n=1 Tax=Rhizophagus clarus TaxID=94130 RepID=A0A8H3MGT3_9GLOM|nr:hypothetical protein GLOIN_2v1473953 [Rhizophagus clarus]